MNNNQQNTRIQRAAALATALWLTAMSTWAEDIPINDAPLFMSASVAPNVFFEVDDSGSMDWSILTRSHWHFCNYDERYSTQEGNQGCAWTGRVDDGVWHSYDTVGGHLNLNMEYRYIYQTSDNAYSTNCQSTGGGQGASAAVWSCDANASTNSPYGADWRILSSAFNVLYYDPKVDYAPWTGPCLTDGTTCADASFTAARSNPRQGEAGYSVTRDLTNFVYEVWVDDKGYSGDHPQRGTNRNATTGANGEVDLWDKHIQYVIQGDSVTIKTTTYAPDTSSLNPTVTSVTLNGPDCYTKLGVDGNCRTIAEAQQNIANWYQYARRRAFVAKGAIAEVVNEYSSFRYGLSVINNFSSLFVDMPAANTTSFSAHNRDMLSSLFNLNWPMSGTPLRSGLERVGKYYDNTLSGHDDPIIGACQKNYAVLFTDGYWNGDDNFAIGNQDGDGHNDTLADVARRYYDTDLSGLPNDVPADSFDTNRRQHMVTYGVAFGVQGALTDTDNPKDGWPDDASGNNLVESSDWGNPFNNAPAKIDDLWHAAYNSRGTFASAATAADVAQTLKDALQSIEQRQSSAAAVAMNTGLVGGDASLYQVRFDSTDWSGSMKSIPIDNQTGIPDTTNPDWYAERMLPAWSSRVILTHDPATVKGGGTPFRWTNLAASQLGSLRSGLTGTAAQIDTAAQQRLEYLRGNDAAEKLKGGTLRDRNSKLGDIINSAPVYVAQPNFPYTAAPETTSSDNSYAHFQETYADRTPMVYVGANDGMLHGFNANTGREMLAYVPNTVFGNLPRLTDPNYSHRYYVDGSPTVGDAFFDPATGENKSWHTVLTGGLNKGGQGIYALDITNPDSFAENNANTVLWEFSDADDVAASTSQADIDMRYALGDSFSRPAIVRLHNGQWAAIFGNGYNNTRADGYASATGDAVLYIVDIGSGHVIRKISTQTGAAEDPESYVDTNGTTVSRHRANGLPTTAPIDMDADRITDYVYSGDLFGNLWKFDLTSSDPSDWKVAFEDAGGKPLPLFTACAGACSGGVNSTYQPITTRPEVGRSPDRYGLMVYFGTGKYLASEDIGDHSVQSFYGIIDSGERITGNRSTALVQQTITNEATHTFTNAQTGVDYSYDLRVTSSNPLGSAKGWFMDLKKGGSVAEGERVVQQPLLRNGRIIFVTLIPSSDICGFGGGSWYMELDALTGASPESSPWDFNHDGRVTAPDNVDGTPASGMHHDEIISTPAILGGSGGVEYSFTSGSSGSVTMEVKNPPKGAAGRQSWRQLR